MWKIVSSVVLEIILSSSVGDRPINSVGDLLHYITLLQELIIKQGSVVLVRD